MAKMSYAEQLKHPFWQRKRLEALEASGWECQGCAEKEITLHVHHRQYVKGRMAWEYELSELQVLCESCHQTHHDIETLLQRVLATATGYEPPQKTALALLAGYLMASYELDADLADEVVAAVGPASFDLGILAHELGMCSASELLPLLTADHGIRRGPVVEDLIARWSTRLNEPRP